MYRIVSFGGGQSFAVEMKLTHDHDKENEFDEILQLAGEGNDVIITEDYESHGAKLVDRDDDE